MEKNLNTSDNIVVLDYGSGTIQAVRTNWADKIQHHTIRGILHSRRSIVAHILGETPTNIGIVASDPFCIPEKTTFFVDGLLVEAVPISDNIPDILLACNPAPGILDESSSHSGYIGGFVDIAKKMKQGSHIFIQLDRAFIESFPDTHRDSQDDQIFWEKLLPDLNKAGFTLTHYNYILGLTLDRFGPLESRLFCKTTGI